MELIHQPNPTQALYAVSGSNIQLSLTYTETLLHDIYQAVSHLKTDAWGTSAVHMQHKRFAFASFDAWRRRLPVDTRTHAQLDRCSVTHPPDPNSIEGRGAYVWIFPSVSAWYARDTGRPILPQTVWMNETRLYRLPLMQASPYRQLLHVYNPDQAILVIIAVPYTDTNEWAVVPVAVHADGQHTAVHIFCPCCSSLTDPIHGLTSACGNWTTCSAVYCKQVAASYPCSSHCSHTGLLRRRNN